jgi:hypothetical protein
MAFKSVLDPAFKYRTAVCTNLRETFERIRREQQLVQQGGWEGRERRLKVVPIQHADRRRRMLMPVRQRLATARPQTSPPYET